MIHWPDWTISGTLCGFDADPMQGRATCVAQVKRQSDGKLWLVAVADEYAGLIHDAEDAAALGSQS